MNAFIGKKSKSVLPLVMSFSFKETFVQKLNNGHELSIGDALFSVKVPVSDIDVSIVVTRFVYLVILITTNTIAN